MFRSGHSVAEQAQTVMYFLTPEAPRHCRLLWASTVKEVQGTQETCRGHSGLKVYLVTQFSSEVLIASLEDGRMISP